MSNNKFLKEKGLKPPASWDDLLNPAYKGMIQMADARTSGTAVTRIFSILEVNGRDENKGFDYMKKLRQNVQVYTKSGGGGTIPVGLAQAGAGIFFIVDALKTKQEGYDVAISFPKEGIGTSVEAIALLKGAKNPAVGKKLIDWSDKPGDAELLRPVQDQLHPGPSGGEDRGRAWPRSSRAPRSSRSTRSGRARTASGSWSAGSRKSCREEWAADRDEANQPCYRHAGTRPGSSLIFPDPGFRRGDAPGAPVPAFAG